MKRGAVALLLAILLTGCGNESSSRGVSKLDALEAKIATQYETAATPYNNYLQKATQQYIALVRQYADQIGHKEARQRLLAEGDEVASFCPPCAGDLRDEARKY